MIPKLSVLFYQLVLLVHGDVLLDYTEKSFDNLPNWIQENVDDTLSFDYPYSYPRRDAFMEYDLKFWNVTADGIKSIHLLEKPEISGSLFEGSLTIDLTATADLKLSGDYNASYGNLFPFVENIPFNMTGLWSADATVISCQSYYATMNASINGSITLVSQYQMDYTPQTFFSNLSFDNFLEEYLDQWYYATMKEGFEEDLMERVRLTINYDPIDVFGGFFEKIFKNINYFDLIERQPK